MDLKDIVVIGACRTPLGTFGGTLKNVYAYDLGATAIREALRRAGMEGAKVEEAFIGHCRQAGNGPNPARTAVMRGGIAENVPVQTINMACPSAMMALRLAVNSILLGENKVVVAGGMESMSTMPYLLKDVRWEGFKLGNRTLLDGWADTTDPLCNMGMGQTAENLVEKFKIPREEQDAYALASHQKAGRAQKEGMFTAEIVTVEVPQKKGEPVRFSADEGIRHDASIEKLKKLPPVFKKDGAITAANACQMSDGAAAMVLTSREHAKALGAKPLFSFAAFSTAAVSPAFMGEGPAVAIPIALKKASMSLADADLLEVNEAFAVQVLANERVLNWDREKLNIFGGGIALGHPTGMTGCRIVLTLYSALRARGKEIGVASLCGGGGVTMACIIRAEG